MTAKSNSTAPLETGGPCCVRGCDAPRHVTRNDVVKPRCTAHHREQTAAMRLRQRGRPEREQRECVECGQEFTWRSEHPKQETCGKACYMARRYRRLGNPGPERRNEQARLRQLQKQATAAGLSLAELERRRWSSCDGCGRDDRLPLHYDHCHASEKFRGFLCEPCNHALGNVYDSPTTLRRLAAYLER